MTISIEETKDLKRLAKEFNVDFDELIEAYKKTSQPFDDYKKIDEEKELKKNKQQVDEMTKRILNLKKESKDDDVEEQIEDVETIQRNLKALKEDGFIHSYEGDNSTKEES